MTKKNMPKSKFVRHLLAFLTLKFAHLGEARLLKVMGEGVGFRTVKKQHTKNKINLHRSSVLKNVILRKLPSDLFQ